MSKEAIKNPTKADIEAWKKEYLALGKNVHKMTVGDKVGYIHEPDRTTLSLAMSRMSQGNIVGSVEAILANCWLGGDEEIKTVDRYFMGAAAIIDQIIAAETASLEKL